MIIELDPKFRILGDADQYILQKKSKDWRNYKFFTSIESLILAYFDLKTRTSDVASIKELIEYQKTLTASLCKALEPLQIEVKAKK